MLIVDDVADNREMYAEYLRYVGLEVDTAEDAEEALNKVQIFAPQVVVMDLALPGMDGAEATTRIKQDPRTAHVRVLVLTGHMLDVYDKRRLAADAVCTKPCLPADLFDRICDLLPCELPPAPKTGVRKRP